ncbi:MAG TPA: hypothetical protein VM122_01895 [Usitatibacter sp.]|nr:hypothetical protein [Usitatibacter sp.]
MTPRTLAAILAAAALPVAAQTPPLRNEARPAAPAQVQKQADPAKPAAPMSARERARLAKAQGKQTRKPAREKTDKQKKAAAT